MKRWKTQLLMAFENYILLSLDSKAAMSTEYYYPRCYWSSTVIAHLLIRISLSNLHNTETEKQNTQSTMNSYGIIA